MTALIPPIAVYIGLAGCVLSLLVATAQNKWSLRVFFLLALRIAIGWHFLFEGMYKIHSHMVGPTDSNKVFTSEPYFALADGPLGPVMRKQIGDPVELIQSRIVAAKEPKKAFELAAEYEKKVAELADPVQVRELTEQYEKQKSELKDSAKVRELTDQFEKQIATVKNLVKVREVTQQYQKSLVKYVPTAIVTEWEKYVGQFKTTYLKDQTVDPKVSDQILANYGKWVTGVEPGKEAKIRYTQTDIPYTVPQRLAHLDKVTKQLADLQDRQKAGFGQGYGYDQSRITAAKAELRTVRSELIADSESVLADMKKELFALTAGKALSDFKMPSVQLADDAKFAELLTFTVPTDKTTFETGVPPLVKGIWTKYVETVQSVYPLKENGVADATEFPKQYLADWFAKNWKKKVEEYRLVEADKEKGPKAKESLLGELDKAFGIHRTMISNAIPADTLAGLVVEKKVKPIEEMDKFTMWFIAIVGACILFGFLTPVACLAAVGFLVLTYLTHPPFPWLPLPPNTEGNPLFINKNVIEALALLVIVVHPTGRWLGLDALWTWFLGIGKGK